MLTNKISSFKSGGFTLIEMLVSMGIISILMLLVVNIFKDSSDSYNSAASKMIIYSSGRNAIDALATDLGGCFPVQGGQQKFTLIDSSMAVNADDKDVEEAMDQITFTGIALVTQTMRAAQICYFLEKDQDYSFLNGQGKPGVSKTVTTDRQLYVLKREVRDLNGNKFKDMSGDDIEAAEICYGVLSFNIEIFDTSARNSNVPYGQINQLDLKYPIGDASPADERLPIGLRITMRLVANAAERHEHLIVREIWIPMGG